MKEAAQSMTPQEAAQAFFGQDDTAFAETVALLTKSDPRLAKVFQSTRKRFLDEQD
ncbi:hypothetical protein [Yoonia litorea]|uniref:Uncharacterized protein n=1 Tax=Yoonia litorea TaxID=1123755 RepID=A0A1I6L120_9RHOB|nr:hypothetical protein [Yoonia litorea]SFR96988.1 hypothetical protein SAMN05444714_0053 [Yoonia litorea]